MAELTVVVGQGYVGLTLARALVDAGLAVVGIEIDETRRLDLLAGRSHLTDVPDESMRRMLDAGYTVVREPDIIAQASTVVICVSTPLNARREPDLEAIEAAATTVAAHLAPGTLVSLESTTYPGTTDEVVQPLLETSGLVLDDGFYLAFSPERIDPGNVDFGLRNTPKIVGGVSAASTAVARRFYEQIVDTVVTTRSAREAETAKLLENTYRQVNIALVNEVARFCFELEIDAWDVLRAAATKPFGFQSFTPGPGVGGHCIPIDPRYLSFEVRRRLGHPFRFVELAEEINDSMPLYIVERLRRLLAADDRLLNGARILLLGVSYKADVTDDRESPARPIAETLIAEGAEVAYHDPGIATWALDDRELTSVPDLNEALEGADVVVLLQAHQAYDAEAMAERTARFFDTRGVTTSTRAVRL